MTDSPLVLQTNRWITRDGEEFRVEDMTHGHRANLLRYLWRTIDVTREQVVMYWLIEVAFHDGGDMAHDALEHELYAAEISSREEFFLSLPLVKRLRELTTEVSGIPKGENE